MSGDLYDQWHEGDPPYNDELDAQAANDKVTSDKAITPHLRVLDTRRLIETTPPPIDWLADGVFARGKLTLFGGREKGGKSLVQMALAIKMASGGGDVAGIDVQAARVLVIDAENGEEEIHRRIHSLGLSVDHAEELVLAEARGFDLSTGLDEIGDLLDEYEPDLVLLDSYRALWTGDERNEADIAATLNPLCALAHERCVGIGLTHHATKGEGDYRGSTAIGAAVDWVCMLSREREDSDKTRRRLTTPYARFAPQRDDRWLTIRAGEDDGPVSIEATSAFVLEREAPARDGVEAELEEYLHGLPLATATKGGGKVATPSWTGAELARAVGRDPTDGTVRRAIQRLAADGVLHRGDDKRWRPLGEFFHTNGNGSHA